jgi:hypothetical protein
MSHIKLFGWWSLGCVVLSLPTHGSITSMVANLAISITAAGSALFCHWVVNR